MTERGLNEKRLEGDGIKRSLYSRFRYWLRCFDMVHLSKSRSECGSGSRFLHGIYYIEASPRFRLL